MAFNARAGGQGQCRVGSESPQLAGQGRRGRRRADARLRHSVRGGVARRGTRTGDHRLGGDRARRRRDDPGGALRDGPGQPYRPPHAGRRGARLRLEQGEGGVRQSRGEPAPQPGVGRHVDRRQPFDPGLAGLSAQGRRDRARDADRGGGRPMGCPVAECRAENSVITHGPSGRTVRFGEVAQAAAGIAPPKTVALKVPADWKLIGTRRKRLDVADKINGQTVYAIDVRVPGMLCAALAQCPVFGGKLKSVDEAAIAGRPGVRRVVRFDDAVAVVANTWWQAKKALDALPVAWDDGQHGTVSSMSIADYLSAGLDAAEAGVGRPQGDVAAGLAQCRRRVAADYRVPYLAHATLEPQNCTAHVVGDKVEIWVPTQHGESALSVAATAAGVPLRNVVVHKMMLGGGFGRRGIVQDFIPHAVKIAREIGRPVKTIWSRQEDMRHDYYRPTVMARMTAGLDEAGLPNAWHVRLSGNSVIHTLFAGNFMGGVDRQVQEGFTDDMPYDVPNYRADFVERNTHVPVGFWRSVSHSQNCFFKESFVDEMAHAAGRDPYDYRRTLIASHPQAQKFRAVLDAAAKGAGWGAPLPAGR